MTKRLWKALLIAIMVAAVSEITLTVVAFWNMTHRRGVPKDIAAQRLLLTEWLVLPFLSVDSRIRPYTGGRQRYLGELTNDSSRWMELLAPDALLGSRNGRNITAFENGSVYVTNDEGFASIGDRDFHYGPAHSTRRYRIIVVGGSTVFGWGAGMPDRNLPARIDSALKRPEPNLYEVINAGVPNYVSAQEFLYTASELINYGPDLLIVYDGWNDESASAGELTRPLIRPDSSNAAAQGDGANLFKTLEHQLIEGRFRASYSVLGAAQLLAGNVNARARATLNHSGIHWLIQGLTRRLIPENHPEPLPRYERAAAERYENNLTSILNLADQHGGRVALFLQPIMWIDGRAPTADELKVAAPDVRSIATRREFYADARPMFARLRERYQRPGRVCIEDLSLVLTNTTETIYSDSGHLLGPGNQIVADEIVKRLAACGVLRN